MLGFATKADISALEQRLDDLRTAEKKLRADWEDTLDRMTRIMGRLNARQRRATEEEPAEVAPDTPRQFDRIAAMRTLAARRPNGVLHAG